MPQKSVFDILVSKKLISPSKLSALEKAAKQKGVSLESHLVRISF